MKTLMLLSVIFLSLSLSAQDLDLYWLVDLEENENKKVGFVSLSDSYPLSKHPDSLAIPDFYNVKKENREYFKLEQEYRKRFLSKTKISETDSLFAYNYSTNALLSFSIKDLSAVAYLNNYRSVDNCHPCDQYDYRIGFEIKKSLLNELGNSYQNTLVYVGKENPFVLGQMKSIIWKKIRPSEFPIEKSNPKTQYRYTDTKRDKAYLYESNEFQYFLQDLIKINTDKVWERHFLIIDKRNEEVVVERVFQYSESQSLAPLNLGEPSEDYVNHPEQWTGKLLKNKPKVVFGLQWVSFSCPSLILLGLEKEIYINCDNRH